MGLKEDLERFREVGEEKREDLKEYIKKGEIQAGDGIRVPIKQIQLPEFRYDKMDMGGVGQGEGDVGDPVDVDGEQEGEGEGDEAGEGSEEHGFYEMDPEEFADELDEELDLNLEPKGKKIKEITEGAMVDLVRSGPDSTLDFERMWKKGLKRSLATFFDEEYLREVLKVDGMGPQSAFEWARDNNIQVSKDWLETEYQGISDGELSKHSSIEDIERDYQVTPNASDIDNVALREEDKQHKYPEIKKEYEKNAVIVFIRDVSGSMRKKKREIVEQIFTPLHWYLTGKYDNAQFIYVAHDAEAWEVERREFFGLKSAGGTKVSSAYELTKERLEDDYEWSDWNRYIFAAGDGENWQSDTEDKVIPLMKDIDANLHAYLEADPQDSPSSLSSAKHADLVEDELGDRDNVAVARAQSKEDALDCIEKILSTEDSKND
jgi:uncharacterized sporulation protein YeaH/YhbH (DUF444 family)